jgi:hypothetical protein
VAAAEQAALQKARRPHQALALRTKKTSLIREA